MAAPTSVGTTRALADLNPATHIAASRPHLRLAPTSSSLDAAGSVQAIAGYAGWQSEQPFRHAVWRGRTAAGALAAEIDGVQRDRAYGPDNDAAPACVVTTSIEELLARVRQRGAR